MRQAERRSGVPLVVWSKRCWQSRIGQNEERRTPPMERYIGLDVQAYMRCGGAEYGFARCRCQSCGLEHRVPFSCKRRGFCPSCLGRRMNCKTLDLILQFLVSGMRLTVRPHYAASILSLASS